MPKVSAEKWAELEGFWRHHHEEWKRSSLNQREYCELHGLPLKRFGNWRDRFKAEDKVRQAGLLYCVFRKFPDRDFSNSRTVNSVNTGQRFR